MGHRGGRGASRKPPENTKKKQKNPANTNLGTSSESSDSDHSKKSQEDLSRAADLDIARAQAQHEVQDEIFREDSTEQKEVSEKPNHESATRSAFFSAPGDDQRSNATTITKQVKQTAPVKRRRQSLDDEQSIRDEIFESKSFEEQTVIVVRVRTVEILERLYATYILPKINYCSTIYHTGKPCHLKGIKKELRNFWRLCDTKYAPKNVMGLEEQLIFNDLKFMYKVKHGQSPIEFDDYFTISELEKDASEKIEPKPYKRGVRKAFAMYTFTQRIDKYWNYLPKEIRNLKFDPFKDKLKEIMMNEKKRRHRQNLLNFGLDTNIMGAPHGINE